MSDKAAFKERDVNAVYLPLDNVRDFMEDRKARGNENFEAHHILGRDRDNPIHSSIYNMAWLTHGFHKGPYRDDRHIRAFLLEQAQKKVDWARAQGLYELRKADIEFLAKANHWYEHAILNPGRENNFRLFHE